MANKIRIIDIARMADVSPGTVDRVIHGRGRVVEEKKKRVEAILSQVGYTPNLMARSLALKKEFVIVALIPEYTSETYWYEVVRGLDFAAAENTQYNVSLQLITYNQFDEKNYIEVLTRLQQLSFDAVIISTLFPRLTIELSSQLQEKEIPYCYIDSHIEGQSPLAYYGTDSYAAGRMAARLLVDKLPAGADVICGEVKRKDSSASSQQPSRFKGFVSYINEYSPQTKLHPVSLSIHDIQYNEQEVGAIIKNYPSVRGAVMFNSAVHLLAQAIGVENHMGWTVVGYDLTPPNCRLLRAGAIDYLIAQRPFAQGKNAYTTLVRYLLGGECQQGMCFMPIDVVLRENIDYYQS